MSRAVSVVFVCWGNICRSPMGERVAERRFAEAGLTDVTVTSAGVSSEERDNPIDPRAVRLLGSEGFRHADHRAHRITAEEIADADLVLAFEPLHRDRMRSLAPKATNIALVSDFIPGAEPGSGIEDPWYGDADSFAETLDSIERAMPGIIARVRELQK